MLIIGVLIFNFYSSEIFLFIGPSAVKWITTTLLMASMYNVFRYVYYRNYVEWTKRWVFLRVNSFWGVYFSFSGVERVDFSGDRYTIHRQNYKSPEVINLEGIDQESKERLMEILQQYVR